MLQTALASLAWITAHKGDWFCSRITGPRSGRPPLITTGCTSLLYPSPPHPTLPPSSLSLNLPPSPLFTRHPHRPCPCFALPSPCAGL